MRIVVINHITLDGVMQSPGRPDEDTRDGFTHGGWAAARSDDAQQQAWASASPAAAASCSEGGPTRTCSATGTPRTARSRRP